MVGSVEMRIFERLFFIFLGSVFILFMAAAFPSLLQPSYQSSFAKGLICEDDNGMFVINVKGDKLIITTYRKEAYSFNRTHYAAGFKFVEVAIIKLSDLNKLAKFAQTLDD